MRYYLGDNAFTAGELRSKWSVGLPFVMGKNIKLKHSSEMANTRVQSHRGCWREISYVRKQVVKY